MAPALAGWHPGEARMHRELGFADAMRDRWASIASSMSDQQRIFHTSNIPFIPITTIDEHGRPWGSLLAGANGSVGFVESPNDTTLVVDARIWDGDPILRTIQAVSDNNSYQAGDSLRFLIAGIGIEHSTRRRNKFAGYIRNVWPMKSSNGIYRLDLKVTQALGNCPKYINVRKLIPHTNTRPLIACQNSYMTISDKLPVEIINVITTADTVFLASYYHPTDLVRDPTASHAGMNIRAGLPGFIRVDPCNNRTVIIPDYSGNRFMTSLGNISSTSMAGLTIVDFHTGNVLYLTGRAQVLIGPSAMKIMPRQTCVTAIEITGYILVHDALPVRQEPGTITERSPYSPKVKYLVSEPEGSSIESGTGLRAQLSQTIQYAHDIATFRFTVFSPRPGPTGLRILPGQAIVLDFMDWMGPPVYMHMANDTPSSINDDRVRTWTVSSGHEGQDVTWFDLTMREVKQGAVTGALFKILRQNSHGKTKEVLNLSGTNVYADIVGITGDFNIRNNDLQMLWVAGGIGVTPFMAMLAAISQREKCTKAIITLALATREPKVFLDLIKTSFPKALTNVQIKVDVFSSQGGEMPNDPSNLLDSKWVDVTFHNYRIPNDYWSRTRDYDEVFICGPAEFGDVAQNRLKEAGIPDDRIHREGFY